MFDQQGPDGRQIADDVVDGLLGSLDGTITKGEAHGLTYFFGFCCLVAIVVTVTMALTGVPLEDATRTGRIIVEIVAAACIIRAVADILKFGRAVTVFLDLVYDIIDSLKDTGERPEAAPLSISISTPADEGHGLHFLGFEREEAERAVKFARLYLEKKASAAEGDYITAEENFVGSDLVWTRGRTQYAEWQRFKAAMVKAHWAIETGEGARKRWHITPIGTRKLRELSEQAREKGL